MKNYKIILTKKAEKDLDKIRGKLYDRIYPNLMELSENPFSRASKKLISFDTAHYRLRVGDYRVLYNVDTKNNVIYILKICHRKDVYK